MIIAIDAGHGLNTPGKRCSKVLDKNQTREWKLNNNVAVKLIDMLKDYNCEVIRIDDPTGNTDTPLKNRVAIANNGKADVYISIHHNAGANNTSAGGTNVYYTSAKSSNATKANKLYSSIVKSTGLVGNRADKTIDKAFYVIKHTKMDAFLIENGFMDSSVDIKIILTDIHAFKTALGILNFLINTYDLKKKIVAPVPKIKVEKKQNVFSKIIQKFTK